MSNTITPTVFYRTLNVEGLEIFYREAGPRDAPAVLLLHGFPSSSHMFRNLIPMLADKYHVVAPSGLGARLRSRSGHEFTMSNNADEAKGIMLRCGRWPSNGSVSHSAAGKMASPMTRADI